MTRITASWLSDPRMQAVCQMFKDAGHQVFFVGGCVRNALLGEAVSDLDLATDARPERVLDLARAAGIKAIPTGVEHGTVTLSTQGLACEVTTFRRDVETDGRRAVVAFSDNIQDDAQRRDFTMNALYADPAGKVHDPLGCGLADLRARRVRFILDANTRIEEDYLRSLRFFRFHAWYGDPEAGPDPEALAAIGAHLDGLETLSRERVGHEMLKLLAAKDPATAVSVMASTGVLARVLPGATPAALAPLVHLEARLGAVPDPIRRLAALGRVGEVERLLRLSRKQARQYAGMLALVEGAETPAEIAYRYGADMARDAALLRAAMLGAPLPDGLQAEIARGAAAKFPVRAGDLAPLEGADLGARLRQLEARWIASDFTLSAAELLA